MLSFLPLKSFKNPWKIKNNEEKGIYNYL